MNKQQTPKNIKKENKPSLNMGAFLFPPLVSLLLILILFLTGNSVHATSIPPALWGATFAGYLLLCIAYIAFSRVKNQSAATAASLVAQGIVFSIFSLSLGSNPLLSWVGVAILLIGGMMGIHGFITPSTITAEDILFSNSTSEGEIGKILEGLPLPALFTANIGEGKEQIVACNREFAELVGQKKAVLKGKLSDEVLPAMGENQNPLVINGTKWLTHLTQQNKKNLILLTPKSEASESVSPQKIVMDVVDSETGLYNSAFIKRKGAEELERSRRYKRKLSVCLVRLDCDGEIEEEAHKQAYILFAGAVGNLIRGCDSAFRMDPDSILIFLPDTPLSGARRLIERIVSDVETLSSIESLMPPQCTVRAGVTTYTGGERLEVEHILQEALDALEKNSAIT